MPDLPSNNTTTATIAVGGTYVDALETVGDRDWVRIELEPGQYVEVTLDGFGTLDTYLRVYAANGDLVQQNDDIDPGANLDSRVVVGSATGGTFYLEAASYGDASSGTYRFSAVEVPASTPVDTLDSGSERTDTATPITVYFVPAGQSRDEVTAEGWTSTERAQFMAALASISAVANVTFVETTDPNADFQLVLDDNELLAREGAGLLGYFYYPNGPAPSVGVFNGSGYGWDTNGLQAGGVGFSTIVHEALHGLGLGHPHDGENVLNGLDQNDPDFPFGQYGDFDLNQAVYTIMSYNSGYNGAPSNSFDYGDAAGPMALDIAALQKLYGANTTYASGNDTYEMPDSNSANSGTGWLSIWDTGGIDTISYSGATAVTIDLRPATLQYEIGGGGFISAADGIAGGYTIANGVEIENATGGSGNDTLIGNNANNTLTGNNGNDEIIGGAGNDDLIGGNGNDTAHGGSSDDTIDGGANNDTLYGNSGGDTVETASGINTIYGGSGYDVLQGGTGIDTIYGGSGNDTISGGGGADNLSGGRGHDAIDGGGGGDQITGGLGADTFIFHAISDSFVGTQDTITDFAIGLDVIDLSTIDANLGTSGDQAFTFVDAAGNNAGEVWLSETGGDTFVFIDQNGDGIADMGITLLAVSGLTESDFIL